MHPYSGNHSNTGYVQQKFEQGRFDSRGNAFDPARPGRRTPQSLSPHLSPRQPIMRPASMPTTTFPPSSSVPINPALLTPGPESPTPSPQVSPLRPIMRLASMPGSFAPMPMPSLTSCISARGNHALDNLSSEFQNLKPEHAGFKGLQTPQPSTLQSNIEVYSADKAAAVLKIFEKQSFKHSPTRFAIDCNQEQFDQFLQKIIHIDEAPLIGKGAFGAAYSIEQQSMIAKTASPHKSEPVRILQKDGRYRWINECAEETERERNIFLRLAQIEDRILQDDPLSADHYAKPTLMLRSLDPKSKRIERSLIVMPYMGSDLTAVNIFSLNDVQECGQKLLKTVSLFHQAGIVHRDIKPENILYNPKKNTTTIIDFGSGAFMEDTEEFFEIKGTIANLAPEIVLNLQTDTRTGTKSITKPYSLQIDVYDAVLSLIAGYTGQLVFDPVGNNPEQILSDPVQMNYMFLLKYRLGLTEDQIYQNSSSYVQKKFFRTNEEGQRIMAVQYTSGGKQYLQKDYMHYNLLTEQYDLQKGSDDYYNTEYARIVKEKYNELMPENPLLKKKELINLIKKELGPKIRKQIEEDEAKMLMPLVDLITSTAIAKNQDPNTFEELISLGFEVFQLNPKDRPDARTLLQRHPLFRQKTKKMEIKKTKS